MSIKSLREMCADLHVSRRAVQGYESYGLVHSTGKTDRGYLLYDEDAQNTVRRIKLYQKYGFSIKDICSIFDMSNEELAECLKIKKCELLAKKEVIDETISEITREISELSI